MLPGVLRGPRQSPSEGLRSTAVLLAVQRASSGPSEVTTKLVNLTDRNCNLKQKLGELQARPPGTISIRTFASSGRCASRVPEDQDRA